MTYDKWKLETPEDEYARKNGSPRRGVYRVTMTRTMEMTTVVEVEASSRDDAIDDAAIATKDIPVHKWTISQDDFDVLDVEEPPEPDLDPVDDALALDDACEPMANDDERDP